MKLMLGKHLKFYTGEFTSPQCIKKSFESVQKCLRRQNFLHARPKKTESWQIYRL